MHSLSRDERAPASQSSEFNTTPSASGYGGVRAAGNEALSPRASPKAPAASCARAMPHPGLLPISQRARALPIEHPVFSTAASCSPPVAFSARRSCWEGCFLLCIFADGETEAAKCPPLTHTAPPRLLPARAALELLHFRNSSFLLHQVRRFEPRHKAILVLKAWVWPGPDEGMPQLSSSSLPRRAPLSSPFPADQRFKAGEQQRAASPHLLRAAGRSH